MTVLWEKLDLGVGDPDEPEGVGIGIWSGHRLLGKMIPEPELNDAEAFVFYRVGMEGVLAEEKILDQLRDQIDTGIIKEGE
jgi:hypothetical protein